MRYCLYVFTFILSCGLSLKAAAKERVEVQVGAYGFAPYYDAAKGVGLLSSVLKLLNESQQEYHFKMTEIPSKRRYRLFQEHRFDMIFFEDPRWGWQTFPHYEIPLGIQDGEVYIALNKKGRGQSFFNSLKGKRIAGILGYHYAFANFETDESSLRSKFDIYLVSHNQASVRLVLHERVDVGVVPRSYILSYLHEFPGDRGRILISEKYDQHYDLKLLVHPKAPIHRAQLEDLLKKVLATSQYQELFQGVSSAAPTP